MICIVWYHVIFNQINIYRVPILQQLTAQSINEFCGVQMYSIYRMICVLFATWFWNHYFFIISVKTPQICTFKVLLLLLHLCYSWIFCICTSSSIATYHNQSIFLTNHLSYHSWINQLFICFFIVCWTNWFLIKFVWLTLYVGVHVHVRIVNI